MQVGLSAGGTPEAMLALIRDQAEQQKATNPDAELFLDAAVALVEQGTAGLPPTASVSVNVGISIAVFTPQG